MITDPTAVTDRRRLSRSQRSARGHGRSGIPSFAELIRRYGSVQVRNAATIGGNIANGSPIGDGPPALIALGATLDICGAGNGPGGCLPLEAFLPRLRRSRIATTRRVRREPCSFPDQAGHPALLQTVEALRPGYLGRVCALISTSRVDGRHRHRRADRLWRHGGDPETGNLAVRGRADWGKSVGAEATRGPRRPARLCRGFRAR